MTEEQIDKMEAINNRRISGEITKEEAIDLIDVEVFGNTPVKIKDVEKIGDEEYECTNEQVAKLETIEMLLGYNECTYDGGTITLEQISNHYLDMNISGNYTFNTTNAWEIDRFDSYFIQVDEDDDSMFSTWLEIYQKNNPDEDLSFYFNGKVDEPMECYYEFSRNDDGSQSEDSKKFFEFIQKVGSIDQEDED